MTTLSLVLVFAAASLIMTVVPLQIHTIAQIEIPQLPLIDPQRDNQTHDSMTQRVLNVEDQIMRLAYQKKLNNDTAGYNGAVEGNNVFVCYDAAHNKDNMTLQSGDCDNLVTNLAIALKALPVKTGLVPLMTKVANQYLGMRGIIGNGTG